MAWPEKVPILDADDICKGLYHGDNGSHCLRGWCMVTFTENDEFLKAGRMLSDEVYANHAEDVVTFNDKPSNSPAKVAKLWNRAMRKLGYTVLCER